jgi:hypothetical protein
MNVAVRVSAPLSLWALRLLTDRPMSNLPDRPDFLECGPNGTYFGTPLFMEKLCNFAWPDAVSW